MADETKLIQGYVDGFSGRFIEGWAVYDSTDATCLVKVSTPDGCEIGRGRASHPREDLRGVGNGRIDIAFRIAVDYPAEAEALHITVDDVPLRGSPLAIGRGFFDGAFVVQSGVICGTVTERAANAPPPRVRFEDQYGRIVAEGHASLSPDRDPDEPAVASIELPLRPECFGFDELVLRAFANDVEFARNLGPARLTGYLDELSMTQCRGWLLSPDAPQQQPEIEVFYDGELTGRGRCELPRSDLKGLHPDAWKAGFDFRLRPPRKRCDTAACISIRLSNSETELFNGPFVVSDRTELVAAARRAAVLVRADERISTAERAAVQHAMTELIQKCRHGPETIRAPLDAPKRTGPRMRRFNIIIPIYRGVEITRVCIQSVLATRDPNRDAVVLINDCSPEAAMAPMLADLSGDPGVYLLDNTSNLGFVGSVNRALAFSRIGHVVLLNSDTRVFAGAWDEMERLLVAGPNIGTITAMSNNATIFSYPHVTLASEKPLRDASWAELAAAALEANAGRVVDMPTGHGFCMLVRRDVLDSVGHLDPRFGHGYGEENDLCMRAADQGWRNVAACAVLVEHREGVSFQGDKAALVATNLPQLEALYPEYTSTVIAFQRTDALRVARWPLDRLRLRRAATAGTGYVLVVLNWLEGGTKLAIQDMENAYGYDGRERITLTCRADGMRELDVVHPLIHSVFARDEDEALFALLDDAGVDLVLVHQLLGSTWDFVLRLGRWGNARQMKFYVHDFYTICPRVTMMDSSHHFCRAADAGTCARCVEMGGSHDASRLESLSPAEHRAFFEGFLRQCTAVIAPSNDTVNWVHRVFPEIAITATPHPQYGVVFPDTVREGDPNQILMFGAIGRQKGSRRLLELALQACLTHPALRFHVVGYTDIDQELQAVGNVTITGPYQSEELGRLVEKTQARVALFLPEAPETFSYTLTEAWSLGLWPIVPRLGAMAERVKDRKNGSIVDALDVSALVAVLRLVDGTGSNGSTQAVALSPRRLTHSSGKLLHRPIYPRLQRSMTSQPIGVTC
jgi:GT2 family glycosyltransferase/glycosyltransferase involved in cell wall biosynthesis